LENSSCGSLVVLMLILILEVLVTCDVAEIEMIHYEFVEPLLYRAKFTLLLKKKQYALPYRNNIPKGINCTVNQRIYTTSAATNTQKKQRNGPTYYKDCLN
jgi:hypothetical protein